MSANVVCFSGGKDSTAMLLRMFEKKIPIDEIIFVDSTKEFPAMYSHILAVEKYINRKITRLVFDFDYWLGSYVRPAGKYFGQIGYGFPTIKFRWCTNLKIGLQRSYLKKYKGKIIKYIGIAADEAFRIRRTIDRKAKYPLAEDGITEKKALDYCYSHGFTWSGLYNDFVRVSCYCCPFKRLRELYQLYKKYPDLWANIKHMETKSIRKFRPQKTAEQIECVFRCWDKQLMLRL